MNRFSTLVILALLLALPTAAQKKARRTVVEKKTPEQQLYDELLPSTAKVMFIDSMVVDKETFLSALPLPKDAGTIEKIREGVEYTNEFADTRIFSSGDSISGHHLYISYRYGSDWDSPRELTELDNEEQDYPFLMADGVTLYFSAEGEGTVGGRDIFRTLYNTEDLEFYEATNIGLPYNSPQNDYLLAISDVDQLGWLVTDRHQEEGKVCIYTFVPTAQRVGFDEDVPLSAIKDYAEIRQIRDTWAFGDYSEAYARNENLLHRLDETEEGGKIEFVVNDGTVYTSITDFQSKATQEQYLELQAAKEKMAQLNALLDSMRISFSEASRTKRGDIGRNIASLEEEIDRLDNEINLSEKDLRQKENK